MRMVEEAVPADWQSAFSANQKRHVNHSYDVFLGANYYALCSALVFEEDDENEAERERMREHAGPQIKKKLNETVTCRG